MPTLFQFSPVDKEPQSPRSGPSSGMPTDAPPPQLPSHRLSKKPPRLSMGFYKASSTISADSPSTTTRIRKRFSSFLLSSPIIRHSNSRWSLSVKQGEEAAVDENDDRDDITTPPTSASDDLFLSLTSAENEKPRPIAGPTTLSLAQLVQCELGTVVQDVDEEIDRAWEDSRRALRQSLLVRAAQRSTVY